MNMIKTPAILALLLIQVSCLEATANTKFETLPENQLATSDGVSAFYSKPTNRYGHGILGDSIEAGQLVINVGGGFYKLTLPRNEVFEDIRPRLFDVDNDGKLEIITIRTNVNKGAGIAIYKLKNKKLVEFAHVPVIGLSNRWLNIATIDDLDNDGVVEIAWIQTPHIGGILKVAHISEGKIMPFAESKFYSNHQIGERNLCLATLVDSGPDNNGKVLYVPTQRRDMIVGFNIRGGKLNIIDKIPQKQKVDFSIPLHKQYDFKNIVAGKNCIVSDVEP